LPQIETEKVREAPVAGISHASLPVLGGAAVPVKTGTVAGEPDVRAGYGLTHVDPSSKRTSIYNANPNEVVVKLET
jgi:hypothetical protein